MKKPSFVFPILFLACSVAFAQSVSAPAESSIDPVSGWTVPVAPRTIPSPVRLSKRLFADPAMEARFLRVCAYLRFPSPLQGGDQTLSQEGDEAAFFLYGLMINRAPFSAAETLTALDIIHKSFADLLAVQVGDRKPTNSLALLKVFQATAVDQVVKERIASETNFLNSLPTNVAAPPMGVPGPPPAPGTTPFF